MVSGNPAKAHGLNVEGMRRKDWSKETIDVLRQAYRTVYRSGLTTAQALEILKEELLPQEPKIALLIDSLQKSRRGVVR